MPILRRAEQRDLPALLDIYNHYVIHSPATFDIAPLTLAQRQDWFAAFGASGRYQCFVAVESGAVVGWASSGRHKEKAAYETSVAMSVYLAPGHHRKGLGRKLYETLFDALKGEDIHRAYGGITLPNAASVALHLATGFRHIGTQTAVGRKFGQFWDVALYERDMD